MPKALAQLAEAEVLVEEESQLGEHPKADSSSPGLGRDFLAK